MQGEARISEPMVGPDHRFGFFATAGTTRTKEAPAIAFSSVDRDRPVSAVQLGHRADARTAASRRWQSVAHLQVTLDLGH